MIAAMLLLSFQAINVNAVEATDIEVETETKILKVEKIKEVEFINIRELGLNAYQFSFHSERHDTYQSAILTGKGRVVEFKERSPFATVDGKRVPLETTQTKEGVVLPKWNEGIVFEGVDVYVPKEMIVSVFGLEERHEALAYEKEIPKIVEKVDLEEEIKFYKQKPKKEEVVEEEPAPEVEEEDEEDIKEPVEEEVDKDLEEEKEEPVDKDKEDETEPEEEEENEEDTTKEDWSMFLTELLETFPEVVLKDEGDTLTFVLANELPADVTQVQALVDWLEKQEVVFKYKELEDKTTHFSLSKPQ